MSLSARIGGGNRGWLALLLLACVVIGIVAGAKPTLALAATFGLAFAAATITNITAGLVLFVVLSFLDVFSTGASVSLIKLAGMLLFASWFATALTSRDTGSTRLPNIPAVFPVFCIALLAWSAISVVWSESAGVATTSTTSYLLNMLMFPIVAVAVRRREQLLWVLAAFVFGAVVSVLYGFVNPVTAGQGDFGRLAGGLGDANDQAAVLVAAIPIAIGLSVAWKDRLPLRMAAWAGAVLCLVGVVNTLSRGGLIALAVVMLAAVVFSGPWRPWATALLLTVTVGTAVYFVALAPNSARARVTMTNTSGRDDIWKVARRMIATHPITGVGSGNFQVSAIHYVSQAGPLTEATLIVDVPHVAHNIYLELLADLGIPGLVAFLGIVVSCLAAAGRAALEFQRAGRRDLELIARCILLSLVGFMTADFFLSGEFSKQLWLTLALCPALLLLARSQIADQAG